MRIWTRSTTYCHWLYVFGYIVDLCQWYYTVYRKWLFRARLTLSTFILLSHYTRIELNMINRQTRLVILFYTQLIICFSLVSEVTFSVDTWYAKMHRNKNQKFTTKRLVEFLRTPCSLKAVKIFAAVALTNIISLMKSEQDLRRCISVVCFKISFLTNAFIRYRQAVSRRILLWIIENIESVVAGRLPRSKM